MLDPADTVGMEASETGALVVYHGDGQETLIETANNQANMRGDRPPRVRELGERLPIYTEVMNALPRGEKVFDLGFAENASTLTEEQIVYLQDRIAEDLEQGPRPGAQILVLAFADSVGSEEDNLALSERRALAVAEQLKAAGLTIEPSDIGGMGEYEARRVNGDEVEDSKFRRVYVIIR